MKKIRLLGAVFVVALVLSGIVAASASAVTEWLFGGATFAGTLSIDMSGEPLLQNMGTMTEPDLLCNILLVGTIENMAGANALGSIAELLNSTGGSTEVGCTLNNGTCTNPLIEGTGFPWGLELVLEAELFVLLFEKFGLLFICENLLFQDECTGATGAIVKNGAANLEVEFSETEEALTVPLNCMFGGMKEGLLRGTLAVTDLTAGMLTADMT